MWEAIGRRIEVHASQGKNMKPCLKTNSSLAYAKPQVQTPVLSKTKQNPPTFLLEYI
jgi:hypothetical protein